MTTETKSTEEITPAARRKSRLSFIVLVTIALVPLIGAYVAYFLTDYAPGTTSNEGTLIAPPVEVDDLKVDTAELLGSWTILVPVSATSCSNACEQSLYLARQVNIALGKDTSRVKRAMLHAPGTLDPAFLERLQREYPEMRVMTLSSVAEEALSGVVGTGSLEGHLFLADPNGNVMMYYTPDHVGKAILNDLKHLLRISNIG